MGYIFNRDIYRLHRNRACNELDSCNFLLKFCVEDLICRLKLIDKTFLYILDLGARNGILTSRLRELYSNSTIIALEVAEKLLTQISDVSIIKVITEDDNIPFVNKSCNLITSLLNMHWLNNFPKFLKQIFQTLTDDGAFIGCFFGEDTLAVLRKKLIDIEAILHLPHSPHISPFVRFDDAVKLFQVSGFVTVVMDIETVEVEYDSCLKLMKELKNMAEAAKFYQIQRILPKKLLNFLTCNPEPIIEKFDIITFTAFKNAKLLRIKNV